jgi:hypothetical protein
MKPYADLSWGVKSGDNQLQIASLKNRTAGALRFLFLV